MASNTVQEADITIIGAGWYGLVAARTYLRMRPAANLLIVDSDSTVGGVWSNDRLYPNLVAQVKLGLFNYSDTPMPPFHGNGRDERVTGEMIHNYLQKYAEDHDLLRRIRFNTFVSSAARCPRGWRLTFKDSDDAVETSKLMVCTGVTSIPNMPEFNAVDVVVPVIHSRDLGASFETLGKDTVQSVVVVGAAKSAYDAVYLLLSMGKRVTWVIRPDGAGPLAILPSKLLGVMNSIAVASTRLMTYLSPSILNTEGSLYWFLQRTTPGRWCVGKFWDTVDYLSHTHAGYAAGDHVEMLKPEIDRQSTFWANSGLGVVTLPDFWSTMHGSNLKVVRSAIESVKVDTVCLRSGQNLQVDYIVMCTGWGDHFGMFDAETKAELGLPIFGETSTIHQPTDNITWEKYDMAADKAVNERLPFLAKPPKLRHPHTNDIQLQKRWRLYRRWIPISLAQRGDRSVAIMGQIHTVQTPLVSEVQSFWAILYLLGDLDVPDSDTMAWEAALWNAWTRKRYLSQGQKFPYSLYEFLPYVDTLFKDMGLVSRRKSNLFAELFSPYKPEDFNGFIEEYLSKRQV
ncbi:FAD/NAD(P)-binding domain-containing protein [Lepidopterella palustris CBS 459.81]|uniref:FAD/NAD(P)-binding domain-containing protein n=1 Tax=Lepidopterella palustris CBS 459.81 TaxID=1314670 RepID=A0A8E2E1Y8_9PEZI|nr:FAD/NAD(P)-binding domain-containing protein [Lepidopterella palustris CBS 459.81]